MIETWMLLRAVQLLNSTFDVKWALFRFEKDVLYQLDRRLQVVAAIPAATRQAMWQALQLERNAGYKSQDGVILILRTKYHRQEDFVMMLSTIIQFQPNFKIEELLP